MKVPKLDRYQRRLLLLLSTAGFFANYDASVLALLLPRIQATFDVGEATLGLVRIPIELGLVAALLVARQSDRLGRRPLLLWSIAGYTLATALTAISWNIWSFAFFQFAARVFVGSELAVAVTMVVEESPAERRGRDLGLLLTVEALGTIAVAVLIAAGLQHTALGWRAFFLVGLAPLVAVALFRRGIHETDRFRAASRARGPAGRPSLFLPWTVPTRGTLVAVGLVYLLRSVPLYGAVAWWAYFAERERGIGETAVAVSVVTAYGIGCAGYYVCGRLMETIGRRPTALIYLPLAVSSTIALFQVDDYVLGFVALALAVAAGLGMQPVLSALATEPFPTEIRGQTAAWARNGFEIVGLVLGPALVGVLGDHVHGPVGSVGDAASLLALVALPAVYLVWRYVPETKDQPLVDLNPPAQPRSPTPGRLGSRRLTGAVGALAAAVVLAGVAVALAGWRAPPRPEGRAERWLDAVGDTGRAAQQAEATARAVRIGSLELAEPLRALGRDDRGHFAEIEVGRGRIMPGPVPPGDARVPFRVGRDDRSATGVLVLRRSGSNWIVVAIDARQPGELLVSEGGRPLGGTSSESWLWAGATTALLAVGSVLAVRAAAGLSRPGPPRSPRSAR